ncbi:MAG: aminotransferase class III-fold pyridoxal phosphate-dependent enzyme, partial [Rhodospirillaceae bacterium]|nr:aminotransferase class III-fold pyridoxal phosphate-dependent enzyme [Rhodospirillaceae bacterium]
MKFLRANAPRLPLDQIAAFAAEHYGLTGELTALYSERDQNLRLREKNGTAWVLKVASAEEDPGIIDCQLMTMRHIERVDPTLPVPQVRLALDGTATKHVVAPDGTRHVFYVLSFLEGEIAERSRIDHALHGRIGEAVARLGRAMRGLFHPAAGNRELLWDVRMLDRLLPHAELFGKGWQRDLVVGIATHFINEVRPQLPALRAQLIHGDVHEHNLILAPDGSISGIIDFGDIFHGPLVIDIADALGDFLTDAKKIEGTIRAMVGAYHRVTPLEEAEADLIFDLASARMILTPLINAFRAAQTPDEPNYMAVYGDAPLRVLEAFQAMGRDRVSDIVREACELPPRPAALPSTESLIARRKRLMGSKLYVFYDPPLHMVKGEGVWLTAADGRRYLDCYNNVPHVGHCHPHVVAALTRQIRTLNTNTRYLGQQVLDYSERLTATLPGKLKVCAFVNSGSEANDIAFRMAKVYTRASGGICTDFAYHGITEAADAFSPSGNYANAVPPYIRTILAPDGYRGKYRYGTNDLGALYAEDADRAIASLKESGHGTAAFMVDSALMTNGVLEPVPGYMAAVAAKVRAAGGLVIGDEVQSGFGRMGTHMWGHQHHGLIPDIVTIGKPAGNGHPIGVVVTKPEILEAFLKEYAFFSTFGGNNVSCAAGLAVL